MTTTQEDGFIDPSMKFPELDTTQHQSSELRRLGVPEGHMPYVMQPLNPTQGIWFPWCAWNPFQPRGKWDENLPAMFDGCVGFPKWKVLVRIFGWVERLHTLAIGNFNPAVHIVPHERITKLLAEGKLTTAMGDDPETKRSHFLLWRGVDGDGLNYVIDESPRVEEGEWVNSAGEPGEGQNVYAGTGSNFYKRHIREREREHGVEAAMRLGDPRGFKSAESTDTGTRNMFELFLEDGDPKNPDEMGMYFQAAQIRRTTTLDLDNLITLFAYDHDRYEREGSLSVENRPRLYVSDRCQNFIKSLLNYQLPPGRLASEDAANPWKDPIDAARYVFSVGLEHVDAKAHGRPGGGW